MTWFHCGRCSGAFQSESLPPEVCSLCGEDPSPPIDKLRLREGVFARPTNELRPEEKTGSRDKERNRKTTWLYFVIGWVLLLGGLIISIDYFRQSTVTDGDKSQTFQVGNPDVRFIEENFGSCSKTVAEFLMVSAPEEKAQFILNPAKGLSQMLRFGSSGPIVREGGDLKYSYVGLIKTPQGPAIESLWVLDDETQIEAVLFQSDNAEWRIDWSNMVRYSDESWPLFVAGVGPEEGEFRLLARQRNKEKSGKVGIILSSPVVGYPDQTGASASEIEIDKNSRIGQILERAFTQRETQGSYGSQLVHLDPRGMIRLRVVVRRLDKVDREFAIVEIKACHWLDVDDLGLPE